METTNNIKQIFLKLDALGKDEARRKISEKFKVSIGTVNNKWIYKDDIPEQNIPGVLKILKVVAEKQVKEIQTLINVN